jgi:membrane protease YdiL (CAAX protease family)
LTTPVSGPDPDASPDPSASPAGGGRPGASYFTIEGRQAPALFVVGWLASIVGVSVIVIAAMADRGLASTVTLLGGVVLLSVGLVAAAGSQGIERRAQAVDGYAGPSPILVFVASIPITVLVLVVLALPLDALGVALDGPLGALLSVAVQALVYVGLIRLLVVDAGALDWRAMGIRRLDLVALREMVGGAMWALPVIVLTIPVSAILLQIFPVTPESPLPPTGTASGFALSLLAGVLVAPIGEEVLFRGFATTAWARRLGTRSGLMRAALLFAVAHILTISGGTAGDAFGLAVVGFATRLPIAIALGWLFLRRGTIWSSVGLHAAFNFVLLVVAEVYSRSI